ncbi:MAG: hypothetical protein JST67_08800 [Bacteroidetes bacterium]|nr:hypothetical protein [Bacteroidota bacterium]
MKNNLSIRKIENLHIVLWLLKDTCWLMEWKVPGIIMITPTVSFAFFITYITRKTDDVYINIAISFWIVANAYWMCCEFFNHVEYKFYAGIPFAFGLASTAYFYFLKWKKNEHHS